jgi:probable HAF family extracellular repeat protein
MIGLGDLPGGYYSSSAKDVSADGQVIVGLSSSIYGTEAFCWTESNGIVGIGDFPGGSYDSEAEAISANGNIVVGFGVGTLGREAFRWTESEGMVGLGDLDGGDFRSQAFDVSANGQVIVGISEATYGDEAFVWDATNGMRSIKDILVYDYGFDLTFWKLEIATGISDDGLTIVGHGINPNGEREAWLVVMPDNNLPISNAGPDQSASVWTDGLADVTLDGSGSYDDDGDELSYQWSWTIDTNDYEANTVSPTIELPEGQHQIELIVNDGFVDSDPNYCTITVGPFQLRRLRMPRIIFSRSRARYVRARISMPRGVAPVDIDQGEPIVFMPGNVQALEYKVYPSHWRQQNNTRNTRINATFDAAAIKSNLSVGYNDVTIQGQFTSGQTFSGTCRIRLR